MNARLQMHRQQRGGFVLGIVVGLLVGLAVALGVALFITKAPVPFVNKVPQRTAEQDQAEQARNRNWDPNAPLAGRAGKLPLPAAQAPASAAAAASAAVATGPATSGAASAPRRPARDPAALLAGGGGVASAPSAQAQAQTQVPTPAPGVTVGTAREPYVFFIQTGAYTRSDEAEQQRAKLALLGLMARISEREQSGRTVYRVRLGPVENRPEAEGVQQRLQDAGMESQLVRVDRP